MFVTPDSILPLRTDICPLYWTDVAIFIDVSYDPTRELYEDFNGAFDKFWNEKSGQQVTVKQSHVKVRVGLREWLHRPHAEIKITTLLVTHDQADAFEVAEHVVVLFDGKVAQAGAPHDIYDQPATARLAQFIGGANMITSEVQADHAQVASRSVGVPGGVKDGRRVQVLVRPHELRLTRPAQDTPDLNLGEVLNLRRVGGYVKATVRLANGQHVAVECPKSEIDDLGIVQGDSVLVDVREAKVFIEDYSI